MPNQFFITTPPRRSGVASVPTLHQYGCAAVRPNAKRVSVATWIGTPHVMPNDVADFPACPVCTPSYAAARAEAWRYMLKRSSDNLANARRAHERWLRQQAAKDALLSQFEKVRAHCEVMWGSEVRFASYYGNGGNVSFQLGSEQWHDVGSIYLKAEDGGDRLEVVGMNFSTAVVRQPRDAFALAGVFHVISDWRSPKPLVVEKDAPDFYNVR